MRPTRTAPDETRSQSSPPDAEDGPLDENLHYGRAWHRYHFCYRRTEPLRVLDAGCGTGASTRALARLNPGATVLGIDASAAAVGLARQRDGAEPVLSGDVEFVAHDLTRPLPTAWGRFDFVVCRDVLARASDPPAVLAHLAGALDTKGLLLVTLPSRAGRQAARALRQAVDALVPDRTRLAERTRIGVELVGALQPDHPIRALFPASPGDTTAPRDVTRVVHEALGDAHDWTLEEAEGLLSRAGLRLLYAATPWRWLPDRALVSGPEAEPVTARIDRLEPGPLARLIDALDPTALGPSYALYACPASHEPSRPTWPTRRQADPAGFDRLVPHLTGLAHTEASPGPSGWVRFRTVSGALGELDRISALRLAAVDGQRSCGQIDESLASRTRATDGRHIRQEGWIHLAESGLILLEPGEARHF